MRERIQKPEVANRLAARMKAEEQTAEAWLEALIETLCEALRAGESITLPGLGGFYVRERRDRWVFRFNPAQRLRAAFGWSSTYRGDR